MPMIDMTPTIRGRLAATRLPKISTSSTSVIGRAIISAVTRSSSMVAPTSWNTWANPPTSTVTASPSPVRWKAGPSSSMRASTASSSPSMRASTRARSPSSLRSGGALPSDQ